MSADTYRIMFWLIVVLVFAQAAFLHVDAGNINDLKARLAALESLP